MLRYETLPVTPFQQNCSLVYDEANKVGAIVDPGGDVPVILDAIKQSGIKIEKILLTHGHIDHAGATAELAERLQLLFRPSDWWLHLYYGVDPDKSLFWVKLPQWPSWPDSAPPC